MVSRSGHTAQSRRPQHNTTGFGRMLMVLVAVLASAAMALPAALMSAIPADAKEVSGQIETHATLSEHTIQDTVAVQLNLDFTIPNHTVHAGDTATLTWPSGYVSYTTERFDVKDDDGGVVAVGTCQRGDSKVIFTFTDYVDNHSNITGNVALAFMVDQGHKPEKGKQPFNIQFDGRTITGGDLEYIDMSHDDENEKFAKYGWQLPDTRDTIQYALRINGAGVPTMNNLTVTDTLGTPGTSYIRDSFQVQRGHFIIDDAGQFDLDGATDVTDQYPKPQFSADGKSFTMQLGNLTDGEGLLVLYRVQANYTPANGEVFENSATAAYDGDEDVPRSWSVKWQSASGMANGYNYAIDLSKYGEDGAALAGAQFTVTRDRTGVVAGTMTTDAQGHASIGKLLADDYTITETKAPEGYDTADPVHVTEADLQHAPAKTFAVRVTDRRTAYAIHLTKVDAADANTKLAGATFTVTDGTGSVVGTMVTGADGTASLSGLALDDYTLTESKAPEGYNLDTKPIRVTKEQLRNDARTAEVTVTNAKTPTEPTQPTEPDTPDTPDTPTEPTTPTKPTVPATPAQPTTPTQPRAATPTQSPLAKTGAGIAAIMAAALALAATSGILYLIALRKRIR